MRVFISWSGPRSKAVGELLDEWLQCVLQALKPWMSSKDIDRGAFWFTEINDQLKDATIGIICLTHDNKDKPWILFESGALAKGLSSSRVCTLLVDLSPADIEDPLAQFNHTLPTKDGIWSLVRTLNNSLGEDALSEKVLERVYDTYWPQFEDRFNDILKETPQVTKIVKRKNEDILNELLYATRRLDKRIQSIEIQQQPIIIDDIRVPVQMGRKSEIDREIEKMLHMGMSEEEIFIEMKHNVNMSRAMIKNRIQRTKERIDQEIFEEIKQENP